MQILAVSDIVVERLNAPDLKARFPKVELIISCGDLPYDYLELLVSLFNVPLLYVPGNHDPKFDPGNPAARADGCDNLDGGVSVVKGLAIAGLGGSIRYRPEGVNQYSQGEMTQRVLALVPALALMALKRRRKLDIFIAHSPALGIHDDTDRPHVGFGAFRRLMKVFGPRLFLHGHTTPVLKNHEENPVLYAGTQVFNINPYRFLEVKSDVQ